jgi:nitrate reductase NapAB chaperone NapD
MEKYIMEEKSKISDDFLTEHLIGFGSTRGCALMGKTPFDKLETVQNFLLERGFAEFDGEDKPGGRFVVVDCLKEAQDADSVTKTAERYRNVPYVIFNHCEGILCRDDVLKVFAHLLDPDEYDIWFPTESFYVFISEKSTIPKESNYLAGSHEEDHIASFRNFVSCYDFDKKEQCIEA